jgi:hypothetical protein
VSKHKIYKLDFYWYFQCGLCSVVQVRSSWEAVRFQGMTHLIIKHRHEKR